MQKTISNIEKFLWAYIWINPILDIVSGIFIAMYSSEFKFLSKLGLIIPTPSLVVRMAVLVLMAIYILLIKDFKTIIKVVPMAIAFVMSVVAEFLYYGQAGIMSDIQYFARFGYNIAILFVYINLFNRSGQTKEEMLKTIHKYISISLIMLALAIEIPFILGIGYSTYADIFGLRGTRGFFYSGNDITATFMILLPIAIFYYFTISKEEFNKKTMIFHGLGPAMTILCMALIGTKTSFLALCLVLAVSVLYAIYDFIKGNKESIKRISTIIAFFVITYMIVAVLSQAVSWLGSSASETTGSTTSISQSVLKSLETLVAIEAERSTSVLLFSGRIGKLAEAFSEYQNAGIMSWLFGIGRGMQVSIIEMDICEVFIYYGIFGFITMLWVYLKYGVEFLIDIFKRINVLAIGVFIALGLAVGYLIIAGHVLFTVTSGFYFSFTLVYAQIIMDKIPKNSELADNEIEKLEEDELE